MKIEAKEAKALIVKGIAPKWNWCESEFIDHTNLRYSDGDYSIFARYIPGANSLPSVEELWAVKYNKYFNNRSEFLFPIDYDGMVELIPVRKNIEIYYTKGDRK